MRKNVVFRLAVILFIATVISACLVSHTYAKYTQVDECREITIK